MKRETTGLKIVRFLSLLFTALGLGPGMAHLLALPNKIHLPAEDYLTVQQIYRGWALLGSINMGALLTTLVLTGLVRKQGKVLTLTLTALLCIVGNLIVFFTFTYPANRQTGNWTRLPANWLDLRNQWEYSHAVNAGLYFIALFTLILAVLVQDE